MKKVFRGRSPKVWLVAILAKRVGSTVSFFRLLDTLFRGLGLGLGFRNRI